MTVLCCGSRTFVQYAIVKREIARIEPRPSLLIHGAARGADSLSAAAAAQLHIPVRAFPADWKTHGRRAGPIRNRQMLDFLVARPGDVLVLAFWDGVSRGTANMIEIARAAKVLTRVVMPETKRAPVKLTDARLACTGEGKRRN